MFSACIIIMSDAAGETLRYPQQQLSIVSNSMRRAIVQARARLGRMARTVWILPRRGGGGIASARVLALASRDSGRLGLDSIQRSWPAASMYVPARVGIANVNLRILNNYGYLMVSHPISSVHYLLSSLSKESINTYEVDFYKILGQIGYLTCSNSFPLSLRFLQSVIPSGATRSLPQGRHVSHRSSPPVAASPSRGISWVIAVVPCPCASPI